MMMLTKQEIFWVLALAGACWYPWQAHAECQVISGPHARLEYDYQRDRAAGSFDPIATVHFDTELRCDGEHALSGSVLRLGEAAQGYRRQATRNMGELNMLAEGQDSVGFSWRNRINGREQNVLLGLGQPAQQPLSGDGPTIRVQDTFRFYYVAGVLQPGRDIAPSPLTVSYQGAGGVSPLYELVFPPIPLFARACAVKNDRMVIDFGDVLVEDIRQAGEEPLSKVVRQQGLELECDPGTNVGFRVIPARQQDNTTLLADETLASAAKGVGVKMRYHSLARNVKEVSFGETLHWGRTSEGRTTAQQAVNIPLDFYLVRTIPEIESGSFSAQATIELRHE